MKPSPIARKAGQPPMIIESMMPARRISTNSAEAKLALRKMMSKVPLGVLR